MAGILTSSFPADAASIMVVAQEASQAGVWVGTNLPSDVQAGYTLGRVVALRVLAYPLARPWGDK